MSIASRLRSVAWLLCPLCACALPACTSLGCAPATGQPQAAATTLRVVLRTKQPQADVATVSAQAARLAGVPVTEATALEPGYFRIVLQCADAQACRDAVERIAADRDFVRAAQVDERVRIPAKPARDAAR